MCSRDKSRKSRRGSGGHGGEVCRSGGRGTRGFPAGGSTVIRTGSFVGGRHSRGFGSRRTRTPTSGDPSVRQPAQDLGFRRTYPAVFAQQTPFRRSLFCRHQPERQTVQRNHRHRRTSAYIYIYIPLPWLSLK